MITYVRNNIQGYYAQYPQEIDQVVWGGKIGTTYEDFANGKWVRLSEEQANFHENNPEASVREVIACALDERTLEDAKEEKLKEIESYDSSDNVNIFYVSKDGVTVSDWLTPDKRSNYRNSIDAAKLVGIESLSLYIGGMPISVSTQEAEMILAQIQLYADQCFIITKQHEVAVEVLDTIEAVDAYDNTVGYPEKLTFTI